MSQLLEQIENMTHDAESTIHHAESTAEIIGVVAVAFCLFCILYQMCRVLSCMRWCVCLANPYRRV